MSETEKQEGQKTVVAFITGLLIGGLLVWVFTSSPTPEAIAPADDTQSETETTDTETRPAADTTPETTTSAPAPAGDKGGASAATTRPSVEGTGSLTVADQAAGATVNLGEAQYPSEAGWIVVRDYTENTPGRILGAARYHVADGLRPTAIDLLRGTEAGKTYQVVYYNENGDKVFDLDDDVLVSNIADTFVAQ
jgi:hypothetical protein